MKFSNHLIEVLLTRICSIMLLLLPWVCPNAVMAQCFSYGNLSVSTSGYTDTGTFVQEYLLVADQSDKVLSVSTTGNFVGLAMGNYRVYAINYSGTRPSVVAIDSLWTNIAMYDADAANCFASIGPYSGSALTVCGVEQVCEPDDIISPATGYTDTGSFTQTYVLVDANDSVIAYNNSGTFSSSDYIQEGSFKVYAVNSSSSAVVSIIATYPLWNTVQSGIDTSCSAVLGPKYITVLDVLSATCTSDAYCEGDPFTYTTTGHTDTGNFVQTIVLVNNAGNIVASDTGGQFTIGDYIKDGNYLIYAVNTSDTTVLNEIKDLGSWAEVDSLQSTTCTDVLGPRAVVVRDSGSVSCSSILAANRMILSGKKEGDHNVLEWELEDASDVLKSVVYKSTHKDDGFMELGEIAADGSGFYHFTDEFPNAKTYYKVNVVFRNKESKFTNTIVLERTPSNFAITGIFPVPARDRVFVTFESDQTLQTRLALTNMVGQLVYIHTFYAVEGSNSQSIDLTSFESGVYYLTLSNEVSRVSEKIIVTR